MSVDSDACADITLRNRHLVARINGATGMLCHLGRPTGPNLIQEVGPSYYVGNDLTGPGGFDRVQVQRKPGVVSTSVATQHVMLTQWFELASNAPLLKLRVEVRGVAVKAILRYPALPQVRFADSVDQFEDDRDLYFDGAELGGGRQVPPWRVFFRQGHTDGVLVAARSKLHMSRLQIVADGFQLRPHSMVAYDTGNLNPPLVVDKRSRHVAELELGPWTARAHRRLLKAAKLDQPVPWPADPPVGKPRKLKGCVVPLADAAPAAAVMSDFRLNRWLPIDVPWAQTGKALLANPGVKPPALRLRPKLKGLHRIHIGAGSGEGAALSFSDDPTRIVRRVTWGNVWVRADPANPPTRDRWQDEPYCHTAFRLCLPGRQRTEEVDFGVHDLTGRDVLIHRFPNRHLACVLDYVRFVPLSDADAARWQQQQQTPPCIDLSGFADTPDIKDVDDAMDPDPAAYASNIGEHARCGFKRIYWRIDGQCSDYPSRVNTMRYVSAKVHGVFDPQSKGYGRALKKYDMLRNAVDAAARHGVELYGWMRFNNYSGNVQSDFFRQHPEYHDEYEHGVKAPRLCLAFPEVRQHKIAILTEAAGYGLAGLNLGFLRHPPVFSYHPHMVEAFRRQYGKLPPRDPKHPDPRHVSTLPRNSKAYRLWYAHRAAYLTLFGRELRTSLRQAGLGHIKVSIWVRPNHCLFDGIDMDAWLGEGLCDEVVTGGITRVSDPQVRAVYEAQPKWKAMVQGRVPLVKGIWIDSYDKAMAECEQAIAQRYDGVCTYECNEAVLNSDMIRVYWDLRR